MKRLFGQLNIYNKFLLKPNVSMLALQALRQIIGARCLFVSVISPQAQIKIIIFL
jgi:hypothetical protein